MCCWLIEKDTEDVKSLSACHLTLRGNWKDSVEIPLY